MFIHLYRFLEQFSARDIHGNIILSLGSVPVLILVSISCMVFLCLWIWIWHTSFCVTAWHDAFYSSFFSWELTSMCYIMSYACFYWRYTFVVTPGLYSCLLHMVLYSFRTSFRLLWIMCNIEAGNALFCIFILVFFGLFS